MRCCCFACLCVCVFCGGFFAYEKEWDSYKPLLWCEKHTFLPSSVRGRLVTIVPSFILKPSRLYRLYLKINQNFSSMKFTECLSSVYEKSLPVFPRPKALWWVGREPGCWPSLPLHFSISIRKTGGMKYTLILIHTGFGLHGRAIQKLLRATYSVLQRWFQASLSPSLRCPSVLPLWGTPSSDQGACFPCGCSLAPACPAKKWPLLLPVEQCHLHLQDEKVVTVSDSRVVQLDKILVFSKYFSTLEAITSSWSCVKQHSDQGDLVSLLGQLWEVWTAMVPKSLTWISSCLLDMHGTHFPSQTSH